MRINNKKKSANLIMQGGIMALVCLVVHLCFLIRHIPLTNMWGDEGNGIFSTAYGVFLFAWLLTGYGLPKAVSYLIKPRLKQGQYKNASKVMQASFAYATILGGILTASLFCGAPIIADYIVLEPMAVLTIRIFSFVVLISAWNGVLRGFFMGNGAAFPVVISLLLEHMIIIVSGLIFAGKFREYGTKVSALLRNESFTNAFASGGFAAGILTGTMVAFLFLLVIFLMSSSYYKKRNGKDSGRGREGMLQIYHVLLTFLLPLIIYGMVMLGYLFIQQIMFYHLMKDSMNKGLITMQWGAYFGKYKIISLFPFVLAVAMGSTIREKCSLYYKRDDFQRLREFVQTTLKVIMSIVIPFSVMLAAVSEHLLAALFQNQEIETGRTLLLIGSVTAIFFSVALVFSDVLMGIKKTEFMILCGLGALALHIGILFFMLEIFHLDIFGVLYADIIYAFCLMLFFALFVQKKCRFRYGFLKANIPIVISSAVMGSVLYFLGKALGGLLAPQLLLILLCIIGILIYYILLGLLHGISSRELQLLPGGAWIDRLMQTFRLR